MKSLHVVVTGAGAGIGAATVTALVAAGARVSAGDLVGDAARSVVAAARQQPGNPTPRQQPRDTAAREEPRDTAARQAPRDTAARQEPGNPAPPQEPRNTPHPGAGDAEGFDLDVTDTASYRSFLAAARERFGPIDVLVGNAGVMWVGPFSAEPESVTRRQLDVNVHGIIRGARLVVPDMVARGRGHLITIASAASRVAPAGEATYAATKHAVLGYCTALRAELRGTGVRVSVVMPTVVETELAAGTDHGRVRRLRPEDVAAAVVATVRRPRPEVWVPRRVAALVRLRDVLPGPLREAMVRAMVPDQVAATDPATRADYHHRALGQNKSEGQGTSESQGTSKSQHET